jgi:hypothetical protein
VVAVAVLVPLVVAPAVAGAGPFAPGAAVAQRTTTTEPERTTTTEPDDTTTTEPDDTTTTTTTAPPSTTVLPSTTLAVQPRESSSAAATTRLNRVVLGLIGLAVLIAAVTGWFFFATRPGRGSTPAQGSGVDEGTPGVGADGSGAAPPAPMSWSTTPSAAPLPSPGAGVGPVAVPSGDEEAPRVVRRRRRGTDAVQFPAPADSDVPADPHGSGDAGAEGADR